MHFPELLCPAAADPPIPPPAQRADATNNNREHEQAGPGQRQQALRGEHLDVALLLGPLPDGVYR